MSFRKIKGRTSLVNLASNSGFVVTLDVSRMEKVPHSKLYTWDEQRSGRRKLSHLIEHHQTNSGGAYKAVVSLAHVLTPPLCTIPYRARAKSLSNTTRLGGLLVAVPQTFCNPSPSPSLGWGLDPGWLPPTRIGPPQTGLGVLGRVGQL